MLKLFPRPLLAGPCGRILLGAMLVGCMQGAMAEVNSAHHRDYLDALQKVADGESRIALEMERAQLGVVAHYDFLQFEHIELVRHARALAFPPAGVAAETRAVIATQAAGLLQAADSLEWVIADFLRALAQVRSATANTLDMAAIMKRENSNEVGPLLEDLEARTLVYTVSGYTEGWVDLNAAFETVMAAGIDAQQRQELEVQRQLLQTNSVTLVEQRRLLANSDVDERARQLKALYES